MAAGHRPAGAPTRYPGKRTGSDSFVSLQEQKKTPRHFSFLFFLGHLGPHLSNPPFSLELGWSDGDNGAALHSYHVPRLVTEERQGYIWSLGAPGYTGYSVFLQLLLLLVPKLYWRHSLARAPL